jgi:hypothetical protein
MDTAMVMVMAIDTVTANTVKKIKTKEIIK